MSPVLAATGHIVHRRTRAAASARGKATSAAAVQAAEQPFEVAGHGDRGAVLEVGPSTSRPSPCCGKPSGPFRAADSPLRAKVLARLAVALYHAAPPERRAELSQKAIAVARRSTTGHAGRRALRALYALWGAHEPDTALAAATEIFAVAEASGDKERVAEGRAWRVTFLVELGDLAAAERDVHAIARLADALRQPLYRLVAASRRSTLAVLAGRFDEALRLACEAWQIGVRGREPDADAVHWGQIFAIFSETGVPDAERERMEATARRLAALSPLGDAHAAGLALICLRRGHTDEALARFEALARRGFADLPRDMTYVWCLTLLATLCVALGDVGRAAKLYDALAPTRVDAPWAPAR